MIKVNLQVLVKSDSDAVVARLSQSVKLPFAPYKDLMIGDGAASFIVKSVVYDLREGTMAWCVRECSTKEKVMRTAAYLEAGGWLWENRAQFFGSGDA